MVILKKIKSSTLIETLIASVIIVIVFSIASLSLNNIFKGIIKRNDSAYKNRIKELLYFSKYNKLSIPYYEENNKWGIRIENIGNEIKLISINKNTNQEDEILILNDTF